jgi:hypothetical protein
MPRAVVIRQRLTQSIACGECYRRVDHGMAMAQPTQWQSRCRIRHTINRLPPVLRQKIHLENK